MPRSRDGSDEMDNLALCCLGCNNIKLTSVEAFDPVTREIVPLYHPRRQRWSDHFDWNLDFTLVVGLTQTGRATIEKLQLNREGLVNYRRVLAAMGEHPPTDPIRRRHY